MKNLSQLIEDVAHEGPEQTLRRCGATDQGFTDAQAEASRLAHGSNVLAKARRTPWWKRLFTAFITPFTVVLLLLATLSLLTDVVFTAPSQRDPSTVIIMITMILISGIISFVQSWRTDDAVHSLLGLVSVTASVRRNGTFAEIPTDQIVVGDIVSVEAGDMVPADMRLLTSKDLFCSASSLNGESSPSEKVADRLPAQGQGYLDYPDVLYEGTSIVSGCGTGVVFEVGSNTVFGHLAQSVGSTTPKKTPFDKGINAVSRLLLIMTAVIAPLVLVINGLSKGNWLDALLFAIATAVGLTPEMLPVIVTSNLVRGSVEMSRHGTIVKQMDSIQDFGSADILCTDKTGTLTENRVVLERHYGLDMKETDHVLRLAYLNARYQTGMRDLTDKAVVDAASARLDVAAIRRTWVKEDEIPFDFARRRMSVVVREGDSRLLVTKGAAEEMLACCDTEEIDGQERPLDAAARKSVLDTVDRLNRRGLRVILLAYKHDPAPVDVLTAKDESHLTLAGYLAFLDPPKMSAAKAVRSLQSNGVHVKVLTGDNAAVSRQVCGRVGIDASTILDGATIATYSDKQLQDAAEKCDVFVKLDPQDKERVIRALRADGHTVAYMGDGINDTPAMHAADVAISVDTAVDVAKESADIILLHKDLGVLEKGVLIGRKVFGNTMKYIKITLSSNFGNILSILAASLFLPFLPMLPLQLLVLDLLYGTSCLAIPWDVMDRGFLSVPREWSTKNLPRFMFCFGPTSSVFDLVTFALLYFWVCPAVVGGQYASLGASGKALFIAVFHAGWFIESLWTQEMVIHALRDPRFPFLRQHATAPVLVTTLGAGFIGTILPFTALAPSFRFGPLPAWYLLVVAVLLVGYLLLVTLVKDVYIRRTGSLI